MQSHLACAYKDLFKCSVLKDSLEEEAGKKEKEKEVEGFRFYKMNQDPDCNLFSLCNFLPES